MDDKKLIDYIRANFPRPFSFQELVLRLHVGGTERILLRRQMSKLVSRGELVRIKNQRYGLPDSMNLVIGILQASSQGFGFVIPDDVRKPDIYVEGANFGTALHGDKIMVRVEGKNRNDKPFGKIVKVIERARHQIVGVFDSNRNFCFVVPDEKRIFHDIYIHPKKTLKAKKGQKVVVLLDPWSSDQLNPEGEIISILGYPDDQGVDILSIIEKYELPSIFPSLVLREAEKIAREQVHVDGRSDLRNLQIITIDPFDAKDFDDAISLEKTSNGYRLGVHIADVSHYVPEGTPLDKEARLRGNSVYLVDRVIPMLPPQLSNGICSLQPEVDRLAFSCFMDFDREGKLLTASFIDSIIHSHARFTYEQVQSILVDKDKSLSEEYKNFLPLLGNMAELAMLLRSQREQEGAVNFNLPESKVVLNEKGQPVNIVMIENNLSHQVIEEFMLAANRSVATHFQNSQIPFLYRIHPPPELSQIMEFAAFIRPLGYSMKITDTIKPKEFQKLLHQIEGKPEEHLINQILLRSMKEAKYSPENIGHFGLACPNYTHFTSPIRRYPDLVVHRLLRKTLTTATNSQDLEAEKLYDELESIGKHTSATERLAMEAERETHLIKKLEFLKAHLGDEFEGVISGVMSFGFFVELTDFLVEGLVHLSSLKDDYYRLYAEKYLIEGTHTRRRFRLGDKVMVQIIKVDKLRKELDLRVLEEEEKSQ